jgi:prepilin-type processing-associated H-X9-DG protein
MLPTEPIGSIPRPPELLVGMQDFETGKISQQELDALYDVALQDTIQRFESTGSPVVSDGEQGKPNFATYCIHGLESLAPDGIPIVFADGHVRTLPRLTKPSFSYKTPADVHLERAQRYARVPIKQAVASISALSMLYPQGGIRGYSREEYLEDLMVEQEGEIRRCLEKGAHVVQVDFTEGRLSLKLDPTRRLLNGFIDLKNLVLDAFTAEQQQRIGVHTCPGADRGSNHSSEVDYSELLPSLFNLHVTNFYIQLASERDRKRVLMLIQQYAKDHQRIPKTSHPTSLRRLSAR